MKWVYKALMAAALVGGALVTAGILPLAFSTVAVAVAAAAGYFHEAPGAAVVPPVPGV